MAQVIACPNCRQSLGLPAPAPARIRCPKCSTVFAPHSSDMNSSSGSSADFLPRPKTPASSPAPVAVPVQQLAAAIAPAGQKMPVAQLAPATGTPAPPQPPHKPPGVGRTAFLVGAAAGGVALLLFLVFLLAFRGSGGKKDDKNKDKEGSNAPANFGGPSGGRDKRFQEPERKPLSTRVQQHVDKGVKYLRGEIRKDRFHLSSDQAEPGRIALIGLTLLECGVPAGDADVEFAANYVRRHVGKIDKTYAAAVSILFLNRLNIRGQKLSAADDNRITTLTLRICAGQTRPAYLWNYNLPLVSDERAAYDALKQNGVYRSPDASAEAPDLSNSQFAALALWTARRHGLPVEGVLKKAAESVRELQRDDGTWYYKLKKTDENYPDTATCVGLILLAVGQGVSEDGPRFRDDPAAKKALAHLRNAVLPADAGKHNILENRFRRDGAKGALYFMWTLERTLLILNEPMTIEGQDWHEWGTEMIIKGQHPEGYWSEKYPGPVDTCFALLFLVRANLFHDLTVKLQLGLLDQPRLQLAQAPLPTRGD